MKVVFVLPPYDYSRSVGNTRKKVQIGLLPPLGVGYLAAYLEARGHEAVLVDAIAEQLDVPEAAEAVARLNPGLVGISSFTTMGENTSYALAEAIKKRLPDTPIIMGGPHVTSFADRILGECPHVDVLVPGDGEVALGELVERFQRGQPPSDVSGILYRDERGQAIATPLAECVRDIDQFPHPARHIYKHELYCPLPSLSARRPVTSAITSRGCPWARCRFCYQGGDYAAPYRRRSPENVADEIARLVADWGIRNVVFWDDNFCVMPEWIDRFCDLLDQQGRPIVWSVLARANTVTKAMLERMARSGCYSVQYGIESGSEAILQLIRKGITRDQCRDAVRWAREAGMDTRAFFVLGFPTETPEMADETIAFACELNFDYVVFFSYHRHPGTELAEFALDHGRDGPYKGQHLPSFVPDTYPDEEALARKIKEAYRRYYLRPAYIRRLTARTLRNPGLVVNHLRGFYYWLGLMVRR